MNRCPKYLASAALSIFWMSPAVLRADCPSGARDTTEAERQEYIRTLNAVKAVPAAPAGWQLQTPRYAPDAAPTYVCKGLKLTIQPYAVTYVSLEQQELNAREQREKNARMDALRTLPPDQQKQADDFTRQGMQLSGQSAKARKTDPAEATRLLAQAKEFYAKSAAIHQAHRDKTGPQIRAIDSERGNYRNPDVKVNLAVDDLPVIANSRSEKVQIPGVLLAFFNERTDLVMSFGRDAAGRNVRLWLEGDRERVLTIARLLAGSSLRALAAK